MSTNRTEGITPEPVQGRGPHLTECGRKCGVLAGVKFCSSGVQSLAFGVQLLNRIVHSER